MIGNLREFCVNVRQTRGDIAVAVVAGYAVLGVRVQTGGRRGRAAQQSRWTTRIVLHMTTCACVLSNRDIGSNIRGRQERIGKGGMRIGRPQHQRVQIAIDRARRSSMAGKAHRASRTVSHQKVQGNRVAILNMRIMAALTFNIPVDERYLLQRILGLSLRYQTGHQVRLILELIEAEGVRILQTGPKNIARTHRALHLDLAVGHGLTWSNGSVMATQAQAAGRSDGWLCHRLGWVGGTAVEGVSL